MKIYYTQAEVEKDIKDGVLAISDDVTFECNIYIEASINACDINARDINAWDINACDINACDINARDINAWDINARDINVRDINACDIKAWDINAWDIIYYAFCNAYENITCTSIKARRSPSHPPVCLDGKLTIKPKEVETIQINGKTYNRAEVEKRLAELETIE